MGCLSDREKGHVPMEERWDYVVRGSDYPGQDALGTQMNTDSQSSRTSMISNPNHAGHPSPTSSFGCS